jgi:hypothetical protein
VNRKSWSRVRHVKPPRSREGRNAGAGCALHSIRFHHHHVLDDADQTNQTGIRAIHAHSCAHPSASHPCTYPIPLAPSRSRPVACMPEAACGGACIHGCTVRMRYVVPIPYMYIHLMYMYVHVRSNCAPAVPASPPSLSPYLPPLHSPTTRRMTPLSTRLTAAFAAARRNSNRSVKGGAWRPVCGLRRLVEGGELRRYLETVPRWYSAPSGLLYSAEAVTWFPNRLLRSQPHGLDRRTTVALASPASPDTTDRRAA